MAPSPLHGLNIVQPDTSADQYADTQDPLLANAHHFPDLAAQLDLWSNLTFQTDEPLLDRHSHKPSAKDGLASPLVGEDDKDDDIEAEGPASLEGHVNAVNPTAVSNTPTAAPQQQPHYDMGALFAGFGIDPFTLPQAAAPPPPQAATLAQLLAAYPFANAPFLPSAQALGVAPAALSTGPQRAPSASEPAAPTKRSRARRASTAVSSASPAPTATAVDEEADDGSASTGLSPAEDKRRRNTAASARFRMKKKEREAALERRAQELETRVSALERECEGLRRENGWLKGLVVGVTGASQGAQVAQSPNPSQASGAKRKRAAEDSGNANGNANGEGKKIAVAA